MSEKLTTEWMAEQALLKQRISLLEKWIEKCDSCNMVNDFLLVNGFRRIGIYGYGKYGHLLLQQLCIDQFEYVCLIDKNTDKYSPEVPIFAPKDVPDLDVVIVTPAGVDVSLIKNALKENSKCGLVVALPEILECRNVIRFD